ncbi:MAG: 6-pyruvoyl-tetrahydropterin synthase-related protein [Patescibacteria group bacterium]
MLDPYRMIVVNIASSLILISGLLIYKFIFPKQKINLFFLLILISILPIISIFRNGDYESGDFNIHIYRSMAFYDSLIDRNIMPSWAKDLNATYGYPLFIFNYPLPYYLLSFLHFLGLGFIESMKIFLALNIILSGIFMYIFSQKLLKNSLAAFTASIFYIFTPYHLIDIHFKIAIGEILAFTILPLIFFFIQKYYEKKDFTFLLWAGTFLSLLIMSHAIIGFFAISIIAPYIFFLNKHRAKNGLMQNIYVFMITTILSLYIWLAPFIFNSYLYIQKAPVTTVYFPQVFELFYSPWRAGFLFQGPIGQISFLIGYTQIFVVIASFILFFLKKTAKKYLNDQRFWLIISFIILFLISPYSKFLWENFSFVKAAGSHRLLLLLTFSIAILAGFLSLILVKRNVLVYVLIVATIGYTILNWGHRRVIPEINDSILKANLWKSTSEGEGHFYANSKWIDIKHPWFSKRPKSNIEIIKGEGEIKNLIRASTKHIYSVSAKTPLLLQENTLYFPGWKAFVNEKVIPLKPSDKGIIHLSAPQGLYELKVVYEDIPIYKLLKFVSLLSLVGVSIFIILKFLYSYRH